MIPRPSGNPTTVDLNVRPCHHHNPQLHPQVVDEVQLRVKAGIPLSVTITL